jgi:hypothetical protein
MAGRRCIYMFASRNLLALERAKDAEREVCREGKGGDRKRGPAGPGGGTSSCCR